MVVWISAIPMLILFRYKLTTVVTYVGAGGMLLTMIIAAPYLITKLGVIDQVVGQKNIDSEYNMVFRAGTYAVRLRSLELFHDPESYSLFGVPEEERTNEQLESHTMLSTMILGIGVVPMFLFGTMAAFGLWKIHSRIWNVKDLAWKRIVILCTSMILALIASSILGSNALPVFPVNLILWICVGGIVMMFLKDPPEILDQPTPSGSRAIERVPDMNNLIGTRSRERTPDLTNRR